MKNVIKAPNWAGVLNYPIAFVIVVYWFAFWLLNALDKILARQDLGILRWWGNDRVEKFTLYFDRLMVDSWLVTPTLMFAGIVEIAVAILFATAMIGIAKSQSGCFQRANQGIAASIAVFLGFAIFDVIVGDRAELLEHSTYVGVLLISYLAIAAEVFFHHLNRQVQNSGAQPG